MKLVRRGKRLLNHLRDLRAVGAKSYISFHTSAPNARVMLNVAGQNVATRARSSDLKVVLDSLTREYAFLNDLLPVDFSGLVVDAGGYIGTSAIAFASRFPSATIVTIEPSTANIALLRQNVAGFRNIHVRHAALGPSAQGTITLRDRSTGNWGFTTIENAVDRRDTGFIEEVPLTSLEQIQSEFDQPIAFLKLDIEGAEKRIFDENDDILQKIPLVFAELHDRISPGCDASFRRFSHARWILRLSGEKYLSAQRVTSSMGERH